MHTLVSDEILWLSEGGSTNIALVRFLSSMNEHVILKMMSQLKSFAAYFTLIRLLSCMRPHVSIHVAFLGEPFATLITGKRSLACMGALMTAKRTWIVSRVLTNWTNKLFCSWRTCWCCSSRLRGSCQCGTRHVRLECICVSKDILTPIAYLAWTVRFLLMGDENTFHGEQTPAGLTQVPFDVCK